MGTIWIYTFVSVFLVSLLSLIGLFTLSIDQGKLKRILIYFVSLSTGTLLGDAFIHLIPDAFQRLGGGVAAPLFILSGIIAFFILEKFIHWRHCHHIASEDHPHPFSYTILVGDSVHNFIDGMIIAASYLVSIPVGVATTIAVVFHEIPDEMGNFGSLIYGGFTRKKALLFNFLSALTSVAGAVLILVLNSNADQTINFLIPFAAGGFIYVASADLIPELHKNTVVKKSLMQLTFFILGIGLMLSLLIFEK